MTWVDFLLLGGRSLMAEDSKTAAFFNIPGAIIQNHLALKTAEMQKPEVLTAKNFIKFPSEREKYECWICYEVCIKPVLCKGTCGHIFCMKCVSDTRNENQDICPSRCSSPFLVTPLPQIELEFYCPYNPTECHADIRSVRQFENHYKNCHYVSADILRHKSLVEDYKCLKGHFLEFFVGSYQQMVKSTCHECQEVKLCRSFCRICQEFYCVQCRKPPCSKEGCPMGHAFSFQRTSAINFICDICDISTAVSNGGVFDDNLCNFGICELCYIDLPEKYDQGIPRQIVANFNTECSCGTKLTFTDTKGRRQTCQLCKKEKECVRKCEQCCKHYCIACKSLDIYSDNTCFDDHELVKKEGHTLISTSSMPEEQADESMVEEHQGELSCMRCGKEEQFYYVDEGCCTRLCQECLIYCMRVTTDKERSIPLRCEKGHPLQYSTDEEDYEDECCRCNREKYIKWFCPSCEEGKQFYCFQCRPIPLQTCYFQHRLKEVRVEQGRECHFCQQNGKNFMNCPKCLFFVCPSCVEKTLEIKEEEMEAEKEEEEMRPEEMQEEEV